MSHDGNIIDFEQRNVTAGKEPAATTAREALHGEELRTAGLLMSGASREGMGLMAIIATGRINALEEELELLAVHAKTLCRFDAKGAAKLHAAIELAASEIALELTAIVEESKQ